MKTKLGNMDILYYEKYRNLGTDVLCHLVKRGDQQAISNAASILSDLEFPEDSVLIPIPGHRGFASTTLDLALEISKRTGFSVNDALGANVRECNSYSTKLRGKDVTVEDIGTFIKHNICEHNNVILVDNVVDTGTTALSAYKAIKSRYNSNVIVLTIAITDKIL